MLRSHKKTIYEALVRGPVHSFPARMAPGLVLSLVEEEENPLRVLDPMMGSGTVLAVARSQGHYAIGVDIDPLAVLIAKVWTTAVDPAQISDSANNVLKRARAIFKTLLTRDSYPENADDETKAFVAYWFDAYARRQLAALAHAISGVRDEEVRDTLWCAFSRLIITKQAGASRAMDLSHSRPHRVFDTAPTKPFSKFLAAAEAVADNCLTKSTRNRGPAARLYLGDARTLPIRSGSIDLVVTSPPYLNAIDYFRCSKFSLVWMGYDVRTLRNLRSRSIGTEIAQAKDDAREDFEAIIKAEQLGSGLGARDEGILRRFVGDMYAQLRETARVLRKRGRAVYVVGENTIRGTYIRNARLITAVAELAGLTLTQYRSRSLPENRRYLPPPTKDNSSLATRMRREVVLAFTR